MPLSWDAYRMASCSEQRNYTEKHSPRLDGFRCSIERLKVERRACLESFPLLTTKSAPSSLTV